MCSPQHLLLWHPSIFAWPLGTGPPWSIAGHVSSHRRLGRDLDSDGTEQKDNMCRMRTDRINVEIKQSSMTKWTWICLWSLLMNIVRNYVCDKMTFFFFYLNKVTIKLCLMAKWLLLSFFFFYWCRMCKCCRKIKSSGLHCLPLWHCVDGRNKLPRSPGSRWPLLTLSHACLKAEKCYFISCKKHKHHHASTQLFLFLYHFSRRRWF